MKILNVVGTRPNFIKVAAILNSLVHTEGFSPSLVHTGQHYDNNMDAVFFEQLNIPKPDFELGVGSGTQAWQIGQISRRFEPVLQKVNPDAVLVVGDVNSTLACSLVASYNHIPVIHVEAGLRSFDRTMPEEINRVLTDRISELLFATEPSALKNLKNEGIDTSRVYLVGNVMIDTLFRTRQIAQEQSDILQRLQLQSGAYAVMTLHRPSNVDSVAPFRSILEAISQLAKEIPVIFPVHPRTQKRIEEFQLTHLMSKIKTLLPISYFDMLCLMSSAKLVLTDSGGMQEETTALEIPCITLRNNTERPLTLEKGTNVLAGNETHNIMKHTNDFLSNGGKKGKRPELWDGKAAERIMTVLKTWEPSYGAS